MPCKLSELCGEDIIRIPAGHSDCLPEGTYTVWGSHSGLYINCNSGPHFLCDEVDHHDLDTLPFEKV